MPRSISAVSSAVTADVTLPGYLVRIEFADPVRFSSRGLLTWDSQTWLPWDVRVSGIDVDAEKSSQEGTLVLGDDESGTLGVLVLAEGVAGREVSIWKFYGDAESAAVQTPPIFSGVCDAVGGDANAGTITIELRQPGGSTAYSPRTYINAASGHSNVPPIGTLISWNGETYEVQEDS